ncbi:hypothetical protein [Streptomyces sp. NPDC008139]|uniref:hypothetical protein n=1 Tax=Streptomyces sp. NPDC008139 TaxID=3364814 RepID=UPI0036EFA2D4
MGDAVAGPFVDIGAGAAEGGDDVQRPGTSRTAAAGSSGLIRAERRSRLRSSNSLGTRSATWSRRSATPSAIGAGLSATSPAACSATARTVVSGTSSWRRTTRAVASAPRGKSAAGSSRLAPWSTTMELSPVPRSTITTAVPDGAG